MVSANPVRAALSRLSQAFGGAVPDAPDSKLFRTVRGFPLVAECDPRCLQTLIREADWLCLPGGTELDRHGENDRAVFLVLSGCLGVFVDDGKGGDRLVALVPAGETVGEMSLITGDAHSAKLTAVRDTELLRLSKPAFDRLVSREPRIVMNLMRLVIRRLRTTTKAAAGLMRPKTFAIVPGHDGADARGFARSLMHSMRRLGLNVALFDEAHAETEAGVMCEAETRHDLVLYCGDAPGSAWTRACVRQADRVLFLSKAGGLASLEPCAFTGPRHRPELVVAHPGTDHVGLDWPGTLPGEAHHHVRTGRPEDLDRLARIVTGRAVGLVLAGGGARGFAHLGVIKALREARVPFDMAAGSSMGAIVAAGVALEWSDEELAERMRDCFVRQNPVDDWTLPVVSIFRGKKVSALLRKHFGDVRIEDMALPYFCMTSDLTAGASHVHRSGSLWRALRASVAIPGLLSPVVFGGHLHVDGGIMNNLPVDVMAQGARGPVIAVDVAGDSGLVASDEAYGDESWLAAIKRRWRREPGLIQILMRTGTVGNETQRRMARAQADLVIDPPLDGVGLTSWKKFDKAVEAGYRAAARQLEGEGLPEALKAA